MKPWRYMGLPLLLAAVIWFLSVHDLVWLALIAAVVVEWPSLRRRPSRAELLEAVPFMAIDGSAAILIALFPRAASQLAVAIVYGLWRIYLADAERRRKRRWIVALVEQVAVFEAIFLAAAIWHPSRIVILVVLWLVSFTLVYALLRELDERAAVVLAATWALVVTEAAWVFLSWLVSYVIAGGYAVVPQPTIVLGGLAYCAGSIYLAGRQRQLSRARLGEYIIITVVLIVIVIAGTGWRGTV